MATVFNDIIYIGPNLTATLTEGADATIDFDATGVSKASITYHCRWDVVALLVRRLMTHPDFPWLKKKTATAKRVEPYMADVTINYEGVDPEQNTGPGTGDNGEVVTYGLEATLETEPIETHRDFKDFAGDHNDMTTWVNGATFDGKGKFEGFTATVDGEANPKGGVRSYLVPGVIFTRTRVIPSIVVSAVGVSVEAVGRIDQPPSTPFLPAIGSHGGVSPWLRLGSTIEQVGDGMRIVERWKLSGVNGWDVDIYEST